MTLDDEIWAMLPARPPGRQHSAILAELTQTHPGVTGVDVARALARLHTRGRVLSHIRHGCERWTRCEPHTAPTPDATPLWEDT